MSEVVRQFDLYLNHFKQQKDQPLDGAPGLLNDRVRVRASRRLCMRFRVSGYTPIRFVQVLRDTGIQFGMEGKEA